MKRFFTTLFAALFAFCSISPAFAQGDVPIPPVPVDGNYVYDELNWLTNSQEDEVNAVVAKLSSENLAQIAVVTLNDCGADTQAYRNQLFRSWGIGHKDKNDGLLILVCWYGGDKDKRKVEQEVGYGLEGTIPDLLTSKMVDEHFKPAFADNRPGDGLVAMVKAYDSILHGQTPSVQAQSNSSSFVLLLFCLCLIGLLLLAFFAIRLVRRGGSSSGGSLFRQSVEWSSSSSDDGGSSSFGGGDSGGGGSSSSF